MKPNRKYLYCFINIYLQLKPVLTSLGRPHPHSRVPPVRQSVSKYVTTGLSQPQIRSLLAIEHPSVRISPAELTSLVQTNGRKNHPKIFSLYDFHTQCEGEGEGEDILRKLAQV